MKRGILIALVLLLSAYASAQLESLFTNSIYPESVLRREVTSTVTVVSSESSPLCNSGMVQFCKYETRNITEVFINRTIFNPYGSREIVRLESGNLYDEDDRFTLENYNTTRLEACGANARNITDVFGCTVDFNKEHDEHGGNCRSSTSAFKIAFLKSPLYRVNKSGEDDFTLKKVYIWNELTYNAHRFITLENRNGVYALDALWCASGELEGCVRDATKRFYEDKESVNYRGFVYKEDRIY